MAIEETKVTADNNPAFFDDTSFAADTVDQVFLLSIAECIQYFKNWYDEECGKRKFHITEYFRNTEYDNSENSSTPWWLRTQGKDSNVSYVDSKGKVNAEGSPANVQTMAIRPAMWVNISALQD